MTLLIVPTANAQICCIANVPYQGEPEEGELCVVECTHDPGCRAYRTFTKKQGIEPSPKFIPAVPKISKGELDSKQTVTGQTPELWVPATETLKKVVAGNAEAIRVLGFGTCRLVVIQAYKKRLNQFGVQPTAEDLMSALALAAIPMDPTGQAWPCAIAPSVAAAGERALSLILSDDEVVLVHRFDKAPYKHRSHIKRSEFFDEPLGTAGKWSSALAEIQVLQIELLLRHYVGAFGRFPESLADLLSTFNMDTPHGLLDAVSSRGASGRLTLYTDPQTMSYCITTGELSDTMSNRIVTFELDRTKGEADTAPRQLAAGTPMDAWLPFASFSTS